MTTLTDEQVRQIDVLREAGVPRKTICLATGASQSQYDRLLEKGRVSRSRGQTPRRAIPDDFAVMWQTMGLEALAAHYRCCKDITSRWAKELGLVRKPGSLHPHAWKARIAPTPRPKPPVRMPNNRYLTAARPFSSKAEMTAAGRAADFLRPMYVPVYRCNEDGKPEASGRLWRCGKRVFSDTEIIARADEIRARQERMRAA